MTFLDTSIYLSATLLSWADSVQSSPPRRDCKEGACEMQRPFITWAQSWRVCSRFNIPKSIYTLSRLWECSGLGLQVGFAAPCSALSAGLHLSVLLAFESRSCWVGLKVLVLSGDFWDLLLCPSADTECSWAAQWLFSEVLVSSCCLRVFKNESQSEYPSSVTSLSHGAAEVANHYNPWQG